MDQAAIQIAQIMAKRGGSNEPIEQKFAAWDGHRSIRLEMPRGSIGLATATYSYDLTHDERCDVAQRLAALWNLAAAYGWDTRTIEGMVAKKIAEAA